MSMGLARLSRRSLLRGAASVTVVAAFAATSSCADQPAGLDAAPDESPLLRLARSVPEAEAGTTGAAATGGATDDAGVVAAVSAQGEAIAADFAAGATVVASGWLLSSTEADVLVSYARACPVGSC